MPSDRPDPSEFLAQAQRMLRELFGDAQRRRGALGEATARRRASPARAAAPSSSARTSRSRWRRAPSRRSRTSRSTSRRSASGSSAPRPDPDSDRACSGQAMFGRSAAIVVSSPCPVRTTVSPGRRQQPGADRLEDRRVVAVGAAGRARAAAEQRVAGEHGAEVRRRAGRCCPASARACAAPSSVVPATSNRAPSASVVRPGSRPGGRRPRASGRPGGTRSARRWPRAAPTAAVMWSLCPWVSTIAGHPPAADRLDDRRGVVRGVDDQHLVVVPDEPDVVVDVEVLRRRG